MRQLLRIQIAFLAMTVLFGTLAANVTPHPDRAPARDAGCHEHGDAPKQGPVSYACCQAGHGHALLRQAENGPQNLMLRPSSAAVVEPFSGADVSVVTIVHSPTGEPPGLLPLRI